MARHAWSDSDDDNAGRHPWSSDGEQTDSDSADELPERLPAELFKDELIQLHLGRDLNAKAFCVIMHYAGLNGIAGCAELGKPLGLPPGHYQRHLENVLPLYRDGALPYEVQVPCSGQKPGRDSRLLPLLVPQEELDHEMRGVHGWADQVRSAIDEGLFPPCYDSHPIVTACATPVIPLALFVDALPYSDVDSIVAFWIVNMLTGCHHLVAIVRKSIVCRCGCKGWCTFWAIFNYLHWCFAVLATGTYAEGRHDRSPWHETDIDRASMAGGAAVAVYCLLWIKGDWAECATTLGFPSWNSAIRPCFGCNCTLDDMFNLLGVGPFNCPHRINDDDDYFAACSRCEIEINIPSAAVHGDICRLLYYDKRDTSRGLSMRGECGRLLAGDRVDPSPDLPDVAGFFDLCVFPVKVKFWRPSLDYITGIVILCSMSHWVSLHTDP